MFSDWGRILHFDPKEDIERGKLAYLPSIYQDFRSQLQREFHENNIDFSQGYARELLITLSNSAREMQRPHLKSNFKFQ